MSSATLGVNRTSSLVEYFPDLLFGPRDIRTKDWFLAGTVEPILWIVGLYLIFCLYAGPRYMRNRKPYELKTTLWIYNAIQVLLSCVLCHEFYKGGWGTHYSYTCQPIEYGTDPISMRMAHATWLYYMAKISELLDTVFFVLRKKDRQITFLHVYHHAMMPVMTVLAVQYVAGGHGSLIGLINSFVHVVMYSYYLLAAMGPKIQKYLWWKKYITILQILQFAILIVHNMLVLVQPTCKYPRFLCHIIIAMGCVFVYMFTSFYIQSYRKQQAIQKNNAEVIKQD